MMTWSVFKECPAPQFLIAGGRHLDGYPFSMGFSLLTESFQMVQSSHSHDYDQLVMFYGGDNNDVREFEGVIEFGLGEEAEIQIITKPCFIWIPKGMPHGPLNVKEITKPIAFIDITFDTNAGGAGGKELTE